MLENMVRPERRLEVTYGLRFFVDACGGFEFPCDKDGVVNLKAMSHSAIENHVFCLNNPDKFPYAYNEIHEYRRWIKDNPYGTCHCGERVELYDEYMGACQCQKCGQWYNLFGQELLPPDEWGDIDYDY